MGTGSPKCCPGIIARKVTRILPSSGLRFRAKHRKLRTTQLLQASDDVFRGQLAVAFPFVQIAVRDDIIHGENSLRDILVVNHGQAADLFVRHGAESFVDFIVGLARDDLLFRNLAYSEVSRETISRSHRNTDVAVSHHSYELLIAADYRQHAAVVNPHQLNRSTHVRVRTATER